MRTLNVLIVDDNKVNLLVIGRLVSNLGHFVFTASNGLEALACCEQQVPDLILMDVIMPQMDGLAATKAIRERFSKHWIPIIFLTGKIEQEDVLAGLDAGGDDYLAKPVDTKLLAAKIRVMTRIAEMQQRISQDAKRLEVYYHTNEMEQQLAEHVLNNLYGDRGQTGVEQWIKPAVQFSGDIITTARSPADGLHIMLADSTGHGLAAAIACLPAATVFYAMTQKGFGIHAIAREINKKLNQQLPIGRFVAATLVAINPQEQTVTVWNGGLPFAAFVNEDGQIEQRFHSNHPPLGILRNIDFDPGVEVYRWSTPGRVMICSDGLTEARGNNGQLLDQEALLSCLCADNGTPVMHKIEQLLTRHLAGEENVDDISVVLAPCNNGYSELPPAPPAQAFTRLTDWEIRLYFGAQELRDDLGMPSLLGWLNQIGLSETQFSEVLLVVTELFNNALDHGVLALDSASKSSSSGFASYLALRQQRLAALQQGWIEVAMRHEATGGHSTLQLSVKDSGDGFDAPRFLHDGVSNNKMHGRGIALVRKLCSKVRYLDGGSHVEVEYTLR